MSLYTARFGQIKKDLENITNSTLTNVTEANLTKELRLLEQYGLVHREVYREVPPKVEYSLTPIGMKFIPVLDALEKWAIEYNKQL